MMRREKPRVSMELTGRKQRKQFRMRKEKLRVPMQLTGRKQRKQFMIGRKVMISRN